MSQEGMYAEITDATRGIHRRVDVVVFEADGSRVADGNYGWTKQAYGANSDVELIAAVLGARGYRPVGEMPRSFDLPLRVSVEPR